MKPKIEFLEKKDCEWYDSFSKKQRRGVNHAFKLEDEKSGVWLMNVRLSDEEIATVNNPTSEQTSSIHDQIKQKSMVFITCKNDRSKYYQLLGITRLEDGRLRSKRIEKIEEVPKEIRDKFRLEKHENVGKGEKLRGKLVALVDAEKPEDMAHLFYLQKIKPVF